MRVHDFGDGFDAATAGGAPAGEREMLPDGTHNVTIKDASEGVHKFPENNPGEYLHLTLAPNGSCRSDRRRRTGRRPGSWRRLSGSRRTHGPMPIRPSLSAASCGW